MFLIRTELQHETNYNPLHEAMASLGMKRLVSADDGRVYKLPTGLYHYKGTGTAESVRKLAQQAATYIGHANAQIIVANATALAWSGLEEATIDDRIWMVGA